MLLVAAGAMMLLLTACSSGSAQDDPTPVQTWWITPAAAGFGTPSASTPGNGSPTSSASAAAAAGSPTAASATAPAGGGALTLTAQDSTFKPETLTAAAGAVTINMDNKDSGVIHNLHVFQGADAKGTSMGQTALEAGPTQQKLDLNLAAGAYFYRCDAHPTTMKGTLTVN